MAALGQRVEGLAHSQEDFQAAITAQMGNLAEQMQRLLSRRERMDTMSTAPEPSSLPTFSYAGARARLASPEQFSGDLRQCKSFFIDCEMYFELSPHEFPTD